MKPTIDPAIAVAIYDGSGFPFGASRAGADLATLAADAAPGDLVVMPHTTPDPTDVPPIRDMRARGFGRIWLGAPSNPLVSMARAHGIGAALAVVKRWAKFCTDHGIELLMFNGERGRDRTADWVIDTPDERAFVETLSREVPLAAADAAPGLALGFTSHDMPQWFRLAWDVLFGASSKVTLHAPQNYPADPNDPGLEGFNDADRRSRASAARWSELVTRGKIRADLGPGGAGWAPYGQLHGLTPAGVARVLDASHTACAWALPRVPKGRADEYGIAGLRAVLRARRETGRAAGAIARAQAAHGLEVDGNAGPLTLAALGIPTP